jgi:hypothetical protein
VGAVRYSNHTFAANVTRPANKISHSSDYWLANIKRQGQAAFNLNSTGYKVFRNVLDYGAQGNAPENYTLVAPYAQRALASLSSLDSLACGV